MISTLAGGINDPDTFNAVIKAHTRQVFYHFYSLCYKFFLHVVQLECLIAYSLISWYWSILSFTNIIISIWPGVWKHWADYRIFWPIFITLVLLLYTLYTVQFQFTRHSLELLDTAWLAVSTPLLDMAKAPGNCISNIIDVVQNYYNQ